MSVSRYLILLSLLFEVWHLTGQQTCRVDLRYYQVPAKVVFDDIQKQCVVIFSYGAFDDQTKVSIQVENSLIGPALDLLTPQIGMKYVLKDKYIILKPEDGNKIDARILLSGVILDSTTQKPVKSATIYIKSLKTLVNTNSHGEFELNVKPGR